MSWGRGAPAWTAHRYKPAAKYTEGERERERDNLQNAHVRVIHVSFASLILDQSRCCRVSWPACGGGGGAGHSLLTIDYCVVAAAGPSELTRILTSSPFLICHPVRQTSDGRGTRLAAFLQGTVAVGNKSCLKHLRVPQLPSFFFHTLIFSLLP